MSFVYTAAIESVRPQSANPGAIDVTVVFRCGERVVRETYNLKRETASRHRLKDIVLAKKAELEAATEEVDMLVERVTADVLTMQCTCGQDGCPNDGNWWAQGRV